MIIDIYKDPLDILAKINLYNSPNTEEETPNKLAFAKAGRQELYTLCGIIKKYKPKKILEVGVAAGGTSAVIMNAVNKLNYRADLYCIDRAETCFWDESQKVGFVSEIAKQHMDNYCNLHLFKGMTLIHKIEEIGDEIDLVLLDTNHTMPGEILDFLVVFPYLKKNAIVIVDDILTPILHQLPPYNNLNAWMQIAPRLLWTNISGETIDIAYKNWKKYQYGIKQVDVNDYFQIRRMVELLYLPWKSAFDEETLDCIVKHLNKYYMEEITVKFKQALELNKMLYEN